MDGDNKGENSMKPVRHIGLYDLLQNLDGRSHSSSDLFLTLNISSTWTTDGRCKDTAEEREWNAEYDSAYHNIWNPLYKNLLVRKPDELFATQRREITFRFQYL